VDVGSCSDPDGDDNAATAKRSTGGLSNGVSVGLGYSGQSAKSLTDYGIKGNVTIPL
jgi:hypothetical protein